jgi:hypothetical protein
MTLPLIRARAIYAKRSLPARYDAGWFSAELQRVEAAIPAWSSRVIRFGDSATTRTLTSTDSLLLVDATGGAVSVILPDAGRADGLAVFVLKTDASGHAVTVVGSVSGVTNPTIPAQYGCLQVVAAGGSWFLLSQL